MSEEHAVFYLKRNRCKHIAPVGHRYADAPGRTRTCDAGFRKPSLSPAELRGQASLVYHEAGAKTNTCVIIAGYER